MELSDFNKYLVYTGKKEKHRLKALHHNGDAYYVEDIQKPHFVLKMWTFPQEYYLCRNRDNEHYTLFAERELLHGDYIFRRPIGYGWVSDTIKNIIEVQFGFPRQRVFLNLTPDADIA